MFDTHAHLNDEYFKNKVGRIIKKSKLKGVVNILIPGTSIESSKIAQKIATNYSNVYASCGIHPTLNLEKFDIEKEISNLKEIAVKFTAIGEIGLDYYRGTSKKSLQIEFLKKQIDIALKLNKPVILHNRKSTEDMLCLLEGLWDESFKKNMVFHCCPADEKLLTFAKEKGIFIGVDGDLTYDDKKKEFIKGIPLNLLVFETDSPYLTPEPLKAKGILNDPSNLGLTVEYAADILGIKKEELVKITSSNARILLNLDD